LNVETYPSGQHVSLLCASNEAAHLTRVTESVEMWMWKMQTTLPLVWWWVWPTENLFSGGPDVLLAQNGQMFTLKFL